MNDQTHKITEKIRTGSVSATLGIILILGALLIAAWHVYNTYRIEGVIRPLFGEEEILPIEQVIYEDVTSGEVTVIVVEE
jgi:hypothetical protein